MSIYRTFQDARVWRHLGTGRAYRVYLCSLALLLISGLALRIEAAIYGRRITSAVSALSTLRVGETSKAEALLRLPMLTSSAKGPYRDFPCDAEECFLMSVHNGLPGKVLIGTRNGTLASLLRWWGFRFEDFNVRVTFRTGKVSEFGYSFMVSAPGVVQGVPPPPRDGEDGVVVIGVSSLSVIDGAEPNSTEKRHVPYRVLPARSAPLTGVSIALTPDAPEQIVRLAYDLKLHCLWSFGGCRSWSQLLPGVQPLVHH
jgi:hypothetical protein